MANKPITMNKIRQIIKLSNYKKGKTFISKQTGVARNTVKKYIRRLHELRLTVEDINEMTDQQLNELFGKPPTLKEPSRRHEDLRAFFPYLDKALRRKGITREKLWKEYMEKHPDGYKLLTILFQIIPHEGIQLPLHSKIQYSYSPHNIKTGC